MSDELRWVRESVDIVARSTPEIDWSKVEQGLLARIGAEPRARPALVPEVPWRRLAAMAAIAAGAFLGLHQASGARPAPAAVAQHAPHIAPIAAAAPIDGTLTAGARLLPARNTSYVHQGWAKLALRAGSDVTVERVDDRVVLALAAGSIEAAVTPGQIPGSFVVLAGSTAIAVHGTRFTVVRRASDVLVRVDDGVVSVGSKSKTGPTVRWLVGAHSQGVFSLDGAKEASFSDWPAMAGSAAAAASSSATQPADPPVLADSRSADDDDDASTRPPAAQPHGLRQVELAPIPEELTADSAEPVLAVLRAKIYECYESAASSMAPELKVSVHSLLSMTIAPDGHVVFGRFDPPFKPDAQVCASAAVQAARFPQARRESSLHLDLRF